MYHWTKFNVRTVSEDMIFWLVDCTNFTIHSRESLHRRWYVVDISYPVFLLDFHRFFRDSQTMEKAVRGKSILHWQCIFYFFFLDRIRSETYIISTSSYLREDMRSTSQSFGASTPSCGPEKPKLELHRLLLLFFLQMVEKNKKNKSMIEKHIPKWDGCDYDKPNSVARWRRQDFESEKVRPGRTICSDYW